MYVLPTLQANQYKNKQITKNFQDTPKMLNLSEEVSSVKFDLYFLYFGLDFYIINRELSTSIFLARPRPLLLACVAGAWKYGRKRERARARVTREGWLYVSGKLSTYPFPKPTFCSKWEASVNIDFGEW